MHRDVIIVGGGLAGLSAGIYLGRALRRTLILDEGRSLARWEPEVQNYLGFPAGVAGEQLIERGRRQAEAYGVEFAFETVEQAGRTNGQFVLTGKTRQYQCARLLLATGLFHLPPDIPGVDECLGRSMFFCKDCDAYRVQGQRIAIVGANNEAVEDALAMLLYSPCVIIATNGKAPRWGQRYESWIKEYQIPFFLERIIEVEHRQGQVQSLLFNGGARFAVNSVFTTRGDVYHNHLAQDLGAAVDEQGQILTDDTLQTSVRGLYAAGCVTPANCQMIIAAGQGAAAAQAINRSLFQESLENHSLQQYRKIQLCREQTVPEMLE